MPKAEWQGTTIAESQDTVVVEGNHYFPPESLSGGVRLLDSDTTTHCPWKGEASYYTLEVDVDGEPQRNPDAAWLYPEPMEAATQIKGRLAFWKGVTVTD